MKTKETTKHEWNPNLPISTLPGKIREIFRKEAESLHKELLENKLNINTAPAPEPKYQGHKIRVVLSWNPEWYGELYYRMSQSRPYIENSLKSIANLTDKAPKKYESKCGKTNYVQYKHHSNIRDFIYYRLAEGYEENGSINPPNNEIRKYFGLKHVDEKEWLLNHGEKPENLNLT